MEAIDYHQGLAASWSERYREGGFRRRAEFFAREILPLLRLQGRWLDVGCGSGVFSRMLAAEGAQVLGVDGSAAMIEAAERQPSPSLAYRCASLDSLATETARFDGAICLSVIEYVDDPGAALAIVAGLVRPGGALVVSLPNAFAPLRLGQRLVRAILAPFGKRPFRYLDVSRHAFGAARLRALASQCGLEVVAVRGFEPVLGRFAPPSLLFLVCRRPAS